MDKLPFSFFLFLVCCYSHFASAQCYNALFNFGDSLSDTGNVVLAGLPYGMTYFGHHTGRCSDGRLVIDFIAEGIGLPHLPPNTASNASFHSGANFAFIAAPALPFDFFHRRGLSQGLHVNASLHEQIDRFQKLLPSICGSPQECRDFLSKSLLVVGEFGGNDYNTGLFGGWSITKVRSFVPHVTRAVAEGIERLIGLGAVDLIVPSVLPVGCFPLYLTLYQSSDPTEYGRRTGCLRRFNALSWYHNAALRRQLDRFRKKYPAVSIRYADFYAQLFDFVINPVKYGFTAGALRTCCGAPGTGNYNFNLQAKCDQNGSTVCSDISAHVSWDGIHMTETAHRIIAQGWLNGPYVNPPILSSPTS
ncbi:GDSL esterase/lipase At1g28600-like isoform X2 [Zingiber officinale]|uniref:GDSL esterase/lipase At1g28600-like isoform X2 n=1 Tax=Zingiber officinale TaxID=94328 RepID=UPI001C4BD0AA|nr:GDSL esterase/lipase At1g28600-like isoform X2 [Zingiber officinale]XP_042435913.1 GDSL esterase/lipase At1g28600-like isoform X2 [Zingiber officinale]